MVNATEKSGKMRSEKHPVNGCGNMESFDEFEKNAFLFNSTVETRLQ